MQNFIKNELDKVMDILVIMKKDFVKSLKKKTPSFPSYLAFFKYFKNIIKNIILKILVSGLHLTERHQRHRLYFADKNNKVYLICNITNSKTNVLSDIDNLSDNDIFHNYFSQYLKNALFNPSGEQITFLNNIIKNKSTSWTTRKEGLETIISRYTPDTLTSSTIDLVSYIATTPVTTNQNAFEYINSTNGTTGLVFSYAGNTSGSPDSNIVFSYIPTGTIFNLLVVGGGGSGSNLMTAGGGGGITYYPDYPMPSINTSLNFMVGSGGIAPSNYLTNGGIIFLGSSGGTSTFDLFSSYGGQGGQQPINGGIGGSINSIYGGGGGGGGGYNVTSLSVYGGANSIGNNMGAYGNTYYGGASYYYNNTTKNSTISVPFYSNSTQLLLGGGGSTPTSNDISSLKYTSSGGCGAGGIVNIPSKTVKIPNTFNPNGSYLSSNCYGGGGTCENDWNNFETGNGGNGVIMLWWNNA